MARQKKTEENNVDVIQMIQESKVPVFMKGTGSYSTAGGISFSQEAPYQLIDWHKAEQLINEIPDRFRIATKEEIQSFYGIA